MPVQLNVRVITSPIEHFLKDALKSSEVREGSAFDKPQQMSWFCKYHQQKVVHRPVYYMYLYVFQSA